ncbi:MAG: hypothetical protein AAFV53_12735 [Myxococcota bacterium]
MLPLLISLSSAYGADLGPNLQAAAGGWRLVETPAQVTALQEATIKKTLDSMNFAIRAMAGDRLQGAVRVCTDYTFEMKGDDLAVTCDSRPPTLIPLDGSTNKLTTPKGENYDITASINGDTLTTRGVGEIATQITVFAFTTNGLTVTKTITNEHFGEPLTWTTRYTR